MVDTTSKKKGPSDMMIHYRGIKQKYNDCIVYYRFGDFYEMFGEDAINMSKELDLTLTGKSCGEEDREAMCGVPFKAVDTYIAKVLQNGHKIAICEQLTDPSPNKLVERDVIRVVTPGTVMESAILDEHKNNFIASIFVQKKSYAISWCDITTGEFYTTDFSDCEDEEKLNDVLTMISPAEIICNNDAVRLEETFKSQERKTLPKFTPYYETAFNLRKCIDTLNTQFKTMSLKSFDLEDKPSSICASGALMQYLTDTQKRSLSHINGLKVVSYSTYMHIDYQSRKNLELTTNARDSGKFGTILWYLDKTSTSMGARLLRKFVEEPLQKIEEIELRQNGVDELYKNVIRREAIIEKLKKVNDIERLCGRICYNSLVPSDCLSLCGSLEILPEIKKLLENSTSKAIKTIYENIDEQKEVTDLIDSAIIHDAPTNTKDGGFIKEGYSKELDDLKGISKNGRDWVTSLTQKEQEETGIKNLKIAYNRIFGYYIEVTNGQKELVPFRYIRKQTLTNCERYVTPELTEIESKILGSNEKALKLEQQLFADIREKLLGYVTSIKKSASFVAYLDALTSLATVAVKNNLSKPHVVNSNSPMIITDGRHPIVETIASGGFVPNDTLLDNDENRTMIITGPNMAGKSTY